MLVYSWLWIDMDGSEEDVDRITLYGIVSHRIGLNRTESYLSVSFRFRFVSHRIVSDRAVPYIHLIFVYMS